MKTATREKPMLYSSPMVNAILQGRKSVTRRIVKSQHLDGLETDEDGNFSFMHSPTCGGYCDYACAACGEVHHDHIGWTPWGSNQRELCHLWVRETFVIGIHEEPPKSGPFIEQEPGFSEWGRFQVPHYRATEPEPHICTFDADDDKTRWTPSIFMPRWASRITLEVLNVRCERVREITEADAEREGMRGETVNRARKGRAEWKWESLRDEFADLWDKLNGKGSWDANPFVFRIEFRIIKQD